MNRVDSWFKNLKDVWLKKDIASIRNLLAPQFSYYEDPFEVALTSWPEVESAWKEVEEQEILKLAINSLFSNEHEGLASYELAYKDARGNVHESRGAYYVKLDLEGKSVEFRQWWVSK